MHSSYQGNTLLFRLVAVMLFVLLYPICVAAAPGIGVAFFANATPNCPAPEGFAASDWEWRPLYVSNSGSFAMPQNPNLIGKPFHWQSTVAWKNHMGASPWGNSADFAHDGLPSGVWRWYSETLYHQVNGAVIPNPQAVPGYDVPDYYFQHYGAGGTMSADQLPTNWYLDPMKRWLVWSALTASDGISNWGAYQDISGMYSFEKWEGGEARTLQCGARMGSGGAGLFAGLLVAEYALTIAYDQQVQALNQQVAAYRAAQMPTEHDYYGIDDPSLGQRIVVRRKVPNFAIPSGCDSGIAPTRNSQGSVGIRTPELTAPQSGEASQSKAVTFNESFTTATVPFQFSIEPSCESGTPSSQFSGRFSLRLHEYGGGWHEVPIAGVKAGQWISPWSYVQDRDTAPSWNSTNNAGEAVSTQVSTSGTNSLALAWSGEVIVRAYDWGVSHFDKLEVKATVSAKGAAGGETTKARGWLSVQPLFTRNIAQAGPWASKQPGQSVTFSADTSVIPSNATATTYTWTFPDGSTQTGSSASYTFNTAGIYDVKLKVDPTVPDVAPNAYLFNDPAGGLSYDICRVAVGQSSNPVDSSDAATVQFQNVTVTATASQITADFTTNTPLQALFSWRMAPPDFVGPMPTGLEGYVTDQNATTNHHLSVSVDQGTPYTLSISVQPGGSGTKVYARYDNQQLWNIMTPTSGTGSVALSSSTAPVSFSVPTFAGTPGQAHITWASDVATTTRVQWSDQLSSPPSSAAAAGNYYDPTYTTDHDVTITGLTPGQTYTFYLSGVPQASTGHVYLRHPYAPGSSLAPIGWRFTVPQYYDSGSRAGEAHPLEYLTATSQEGGALQVQAVLQQPGRIRLNYRPYGTGDWTTGTWTDASGTQQWSLALSQGPYELVVDWETLGGQIMSSRPYAVVHQEVEEPQPVGLISVTVVRADNRQRLQGIGVCVDTWSNPDFVGETDANGNIIFHDIAVGEHTVFASEAGYHSANQTVTVQEDHGHIVELWLGMKSTVYGSIKLAAEHRNARPQLPRKPVDGGDGFYYADQINVSATPGGPTVQSHREEAAGSFEAGMKQHGFYLFEDLAPGAHTINISLAGWTTQPYTVNITQPGQKIRHDFVIQPAQEQQGQGQQVAVQASAYSPYRCSRIVGWDWLRSNGAAITFAFSGAEFRGCDPAGIRLEVEALCTDKASGGAGYSADLTFHLSAGSQSHVCKVEMKNPFGPPDPNLRTGKGYTINGKSGTIPAALINQAIATGQLTAAITWPSDVSPQNRHVAFKQSSLTLKSQ